VAAWWVGFAGLLEVTSLLELAPILADRRISSWV